MSKYNFKVKTAQQITDKAIEENRIKMELCNKAQGTTQKNINLSIPKKDKDNTIPLNAQIEKTRKNETSFAITEKSMDKTQVSFGEKTEGVSELNKLSEELDNEKQQAYKKAVDKEKQDTAFWDKYVGVQLEGTATKVKKNIPDSASQLQNNPERFKGEEVDKMTMASLRDADAMLFHIYATANSQGRELTAYEKQQVVDINSGKMRLLAEGKQASPMVDPVRRSLEYNSDPEFKSCEDGRVHVVDRGKVIDRFDNVDEAKANYPEGD